MGGSETEAWTWWTDRKPWEIARKASMGGCDETEATTGWTDGKLKVCEIALGQSSVGRERHGSDDRVDGREKVGNSLGKAPLGGSDTEATTGWTDGNRGKKLGERAGLGGSDTEAWPWWTDR